MKLELDEGRVYGVRYWTVKPVPNWDPAGDWGGIEAWDGMVKWIAEIFGPTPEDGTWTPSARWYVNNGKFWFRNEADRDWFLLRWS